MILLVLRTYVMHIVTMRKRRGIGWCIWDYFLNLKDVCTVGFFGPAELVQQNILLHTLVGASLLESPQYIYSCQSNAMFYNPIPLFWAGSLLLRSRHGYLNYAFSFVFPHHLPSFDQTPLGLAVSGRNNIQEG